MGKISDTKLKAIIDKHAKWLRGADGGERASLYGADLRGADLRGADLYGADLYGADLRGANLRDANLRSAILYGADLYGADLRDADLYDADLRDADLRDAKNTNKITGMRPRPFTRYSVLRPARLSDIKKPRAKSSCWRYVPMLSVAVLLRVNVDAVRPKCWA